MITDGEFNTLSDRADRYEGKAERAAENGNTALAAVYAQLAVSARLELVAIVQRDQVVHAVEVRG